MSGLEIHHVVINIKLAFKFVYAVSIKKNGEVRIRTPVFTSQRKGTKPSYTTSPKNNINYARPTYRISLAVSFLISTNLSKSFFLILPDKPFLSIGVTMYSIVAFIPEQTRIGLSTVSPG